jgi:hypothetical protein
MATYTHTRRLLAPATQILSIGRRVAGTCAASAVFASIGLVGAGSVSVSSATATNGATPTTLHVVRVRHGSTARSWTYGWPVKPFDLQHPVRGFFNDPRIGRHGGRAFHFGIDISAPDGTAVYAVESGKVYFDSARAIAVVALDRSHTFGYWHIVPVVRSHQTVAKHELLGHIDKGWGHVHFAESWRKNYVNPLRNGGLGPYTDHSAPTIDAIELDTGNLVVSAHDTPDPRVPGEWADEPVAPALLQWRVVDADGPGTWRTAADFRSTMLPASEFTRVYTPATVQNHIGRPGQLWFYLARSWNRGATIEVRASDTAGNTATVSEDFGT